MSSSIVTPETLMPEIVVQLNIMVDWATKVGSAADLGEPAEEICQLYRAMAICLLVAGADVDGFFHWLLHSPVTRRFYLARARDQGLGETKYSRTSFVDPVLDAVAARQWTLARDIGALTSQEWSDGVEYEDDFCYAEFIRRLVEARDDGLAALLGRWRSVLEGGVDARLNVAEALVTGKADDFERELRALLAAHEATARKMADPRSRSPLASELPFQPNRWVSVEGLALLAIAERRGIVVNDELEGCPRLARTASYAAFSPLAYPHQGLEQVLA